MSAPTSVSPFTHADREQWLTWSRGRVSELPGGGVVTAVFSKCVAEAPDALAVVDGATRWSYAELDRRSSAIARQLRARDLPPGALIGVPAIRSAAFVATALGVLKAGGAYVPIDLNEPPERIARRRADCAVVLDLTESSSSSSSNPETEGDARNEDEDEDEDEHETHPAADSPAYVLYTSGSTGTPKGVIVPHRAIVRLVCHTDYLALQPGDVFAFHSNLSFDASTLELWGPLLNGAALVVTDTETVLSATALAAHLREHGVTALWLTTSLFNQLAHEAPAMFAGLRTLIFGGEAADPASVRLVLEQSRPANLINGYGPTETTTFAVCHRVESVEGDRVPIGRPIANTDAFILDENLAPAAEGELFIGGPGVALGYLQAPELTAQRFIETPFGRLYRTGDRARWRADGTIDYLGRADRQVKIRGYRIEPGEIEAALREHAAVQQCLVTPRISANGEPFLAAYVIGGAAPHELREFLRTRLPAHMVPGAFAKVDAFPLTANGKLDLRALPEPIEAVTERPGFVAAHAPLERAVAAVWQSVLGISAVGIDDNFFDVGGNSLLLLRLRLALVAALKRDDLRIVTLFQHPTIRRFVSHLEASAPLSTNTLAAATSRAEKLRASMAQRRLPTARR